MFKGKVTIFDDSCHQWVNNFQIPETYYFYIYAEIIHQSIRCYYKRHRTKRDIKDRISRQIIVRQTSLT